MKVLKEKIGSATILIQTMDEDDITVVGEEEQDGPATIETGIVEDKIQPVLIEVKSVIGEIANDIGTKLGQISSNIRPNSVEMAFSLGFSTKGSILMLSGEGKFGLNVKMIWNLASRSSKSNDNSQADTLLEKADDE